MQSVAEHSLGLAAGFQQTVKESIISGRVTRCSWYDLT